MQSFCRLLNVLFSVIRDSQPVEQVQGGLVARPGVSLLKLQTFHRFFKVRFCRLEAAGEQIGECKTAPQISVKGGVTAVWYR